MNASTVAQTLLFLPALRDCHPGQRKQNWLCSDDIHKLPQPESYHPRIHNLLRTNDIWKVKLFAMAGIVDSNEGHSPCSVS
jgi:hypothetical protein